MNVPSVGVELLFSIVTVEKRQILLEVEVDYRAVGELGPREPIIEESLSRYGGEREVSIPIGRYRRYFRGGHGALVLLVKRRGRGFLGS
jgi:hypothetical protein